MKNLLLIITLVVLCSCRNSSDPKSDSIIGVEFNRYNELEEFSSYSKISDTTIYEDNPDPKYGILHLQNNNNNLIVFNGISLDPVNYYRTFKILDTLVITNLDKPEYITIGYCQFNEDLDENLIAIVDKTDSLMVQNIKKVWRANTTTHKIEVLKNLDGINCLNEFHR